MAQAPQAGRRGRHRLRPRRRLRARPDRRLPRARRAGQGRRPRDPARRHPRRRRHPAPHPPGRPGQGQGHGLHRPARRRPRRRSRSASPTSSSPTPTSTPPRSRWRRSTPRAPRSPCAPPSRPIDEGLELDLDSGLRLETALFAGLFATDDQKAGMQSLRRERPGQGHLHRSLSGVTPDVALSTLATCRAATARVTIAVDGRAVHAASTLPRIRVSPSPSTQERAEPSRARG